jgi:ELP3 family radical SAM enzyme/protein acetyltransferase
MKPIASIEDIGSTKSLSSGSDSDVKQPYISPNDDVLSKFVCELTYIVCQQAEGGIKLTKATIDVMSNKLRRQYHIVPNKADIRRVFEMKYSEVMVPAIFNSWLKRGSGRTLSGVKVVTIVLSPDEFSCVYRCAMCPQETNLKGEPTQPRSYLSSEPAMLRALNTRVDKDTNKFDVRGQFINRIQTYMHNGIIEKNDESGCEKIEVIVSGGTWESYPKDYREKVVLELYWSANTLFSKRDCLSLEEEQLINETARFRIIGLTLETRPDNITKMNIQDYLRWGVTRIQMGVQHYDDGVLRKIKRRCTTLHTKRANRLLKQAGFKVVAHLMPDLPGSSPELDKWMFNQALTNPDLQFDDVKIYPTSVCKSSDPNLIVQSDIADWYADGSYMPYSELDLKQLMDVLIEYKTRINPWTRIQRLVRDIPSQSIESGYQKISNLRQLLHERMKIDGQACKCIYCMEIGDRELDGLEPRLVVRKYEASQGTEYHLTVEAHTMNFVQNAWYNLFRMKSSLYWLFTGKTMYWSGFEDIGTVSDTIAGSGPIYRVHSPSYTALFGFVRLRIDPDPGGDFVEELHGCGLIREAHVYGTSLGVGKNSVGSQHRGYGQRLMKAAETICSDVGIKRTAVIAGIGAREYYKNKCGYTKGTHYMLKDINVEKDVMRRRILALGLGVLFAGFSLL